MRLGKLKKVELRDIWKHEALDFTKWLANEENIALLSEEIGTEIEVLQTEAQVGSFNVDILAQEAESERKIIIENQLEKTNHDHLGKLITYASGYDAEIIIWLVKEARDEHRRGIEWLNEHLDDEINIFLIELELWKIGASTPAPHFKIISRPNDWAKVVKYRPGNKELTPTKALQLEFWNKFKEVEDKTSFSIRAPRAQAWTDIAMGTVKYFMRIELYRKELRVGLLIQRDREICQEFFSRREEVEKCFGNSLDWEEKDGRTVGKISIFKNFDLTDQGQWDNEIQWIIEKAEKFIECFK